MRLLWMVLVISMYVGTLHAAGPDQDERMLDAIASQIRRADYQGDRARLRAVIADLEPFVRNKVTAAHAHYWLGFALWRRAVNGFNEAAPSDELEADLLECIREFRSAREVRADFVEAGIGEAGCIIGLISATNRQPAKRREHLQRARTLLEALKQEAPGNPRLQWLLGGAVWNTPAAAGGSQARALEIYQQGLAAARREQDTGMSFPEWGEPELLISIAWSRLNGDRSDPQSAQTHAQAGLALVPDWHYARDILMPQIKRKRQEMATDSEGSATFSAKAELAGIERMRERDIRASKAKDFAALDALFTDDAVAMPPGQGVQRRAEREAAMSATAQTMKSMEVLDYSKEFEETQLVRDLDGNLMAIEWGSIKGRSRDITKQGEEPQSSTFKVLRILKKMPDGEWRIHRTIYN